MAAQVVHAPGDVAPLREAFARIRAEFDVPAGFPEPVDAEAVAVVQRGPALPPGAAPGPRRDARDLPFVTIDPPGSLDLDQAFHAERRGSGYRVHYAISDVTAFAGPGGALDRESFVRGVTLYLPDGRAPMLPNLLGEGAVSLLPDQDRPALLWTIDLDDTGASVSARLERSTVRSRAKLDYRGVQSALDANQSDDSLTLLREIGSRRQLLEAARGGLSLDLPSQEVIDAPDGGFVLEYAAPLPVEGWNAQISLLAGMEAAKIMIDAQVGILRVVAPPQPWQLDRLRRSARGLHVAWPENAKWSDIVRGLDRADPDAAAFLTQAAHLLRGAGYAKLDASNTADRAMVPVHAGVGAPYAHVTAPLRRLADRYANEIVLAHCAGGEAPEWARSALDTLVDTMQAANHRDKSIERAVIDAVECAVLATRVGERFDGIVIDRNKQGVVVQLRSPAVVANMPGDLPLGDAIQITVVAVDPLQRRVQLAPVSAAPGSTS
jgi:exoribonuclease R